MRDLVDLEVGLLVFRHGLDVVLAAIARNEGTTEQELLAKLGQLRLAKRSRRPQRQADHVDPNSLVQSAEDPASAAAALAAYDDGRFLPRLTDVRAFLQVHGLPGRSKSRNAARLNVARVLASLSGHQVRSLYPRSPGGAKQTDFGALASQILRGPDSPERVTDEPGA